MKSRKSVLLVVIAILIIIGIIMTVQNKNLFADRTLDFRSPREKQLAYLKENKKEIGNGTPQGGGNVIRVFGGFNHIKDSSWSVLVYIKDGKNNEEDFIEGIGSGSPLRVEGRGFDEE